VAPKLEFTVRQRRRQAAAAYFILLPRDNELNSVQKFENPDGRATEQPKADSDLVHYSLNYVHSDTCSALLYAAIMYHPAAAVARGDDGD